MTQMNKQILRNIVFAGLFLVPFVPFLVSSSFFFPFVTTKAFAWRIIVEVIFATWVLLALLDANYRPKRSIILYSIFAFLIIIGLADIFGTAPAKSFWSNFERMEGFISLLHLGVFFIVISSVFKEIDWKRWWNASLIASFLMVGYCVLQILGLKTINQGGVRVDGTLGNAIYLAVYMLFHMFIAALFLWREWRNITLRWFYGLLILAQGFILYFTATRGAILGLIGGLFVIALLNIRNRESLLMKKASVALLSLLVVVIGGFLLVKDTTFVRNNQVLSRFSSLNTGELKTQGRYFVWPMAIEGWKEKPILGWGQENFNFIFQEHYRPEMFRLEPWFDRAHNIFLDWLVAGGLVGLIAYMFLYFSMLYLIWWRSPSLSYTEKSIITGLIAAYFFHNFFVFVHLISYILFFSLLAYVHHVNESGSSWDRVITPIQSRVALPIITMLLISGIYFINIKPIIANTSLLEAFKIIQTSGDMNVAAENYRKAYEWSYLGRTEVIEHTAANTVAILTSDISMEEKNAFFSFVSDAITKQEEDKSLEADARYQLLAGSFFSTTGLLEEALAHLNKAHELMPNKQQVYFEIGSAYINNKKPLLALEAFKRAYDLAPEYFDAKQAYLLGAIYAGDRTTENEMLGKFTEGELVLYDKIINAYYANNRYYEVKDLLERRIKLWPEKADLYRQYIESLPI